MSWKNIYSILHTTKYHCVINILSLHTVYINALIKLRSLRQTINIDFCYKWYQNMLQNMLYLLLRVWRVQWVGWLGKGCQSGIWNQTVDKQEEHSIVLVWNGSAKGNKTNVSALTVFGSAEFWLFLSASPMSLPARKQSTVLNALYWGRWASAHAQVHCGIMHHHEEKSTNIFHFTSCVKWSER